jgi:hypothetical protein
MLSASMAAVLADFIRCHPADGDAYVFRSGDGRRVNKQTIKKWHRDVMDNEG